MKLLSKLKSDRGAVNSVEMIMLIALAVFALLSIFNLVIKPMIETADGVGVKIEEMNPN